MDERPAPNAGVLGSSPPQEHVLAETARVLAEAPSLVEAVPGMLKIVCAALAWECGAVWQVNRARNALHCIGTWHLPTLEADEFTSVTRSTTFSSGVGLPGRVWSTRQPVWIADVTQDSNFPRAPFAQRAGLHAAFGLPIFQGRR